MPALAPTETAHWGLPLAATPASCRSVATYAIAEIAPPSHRARPESASSLARPFLHLPCGRKLQKSMPFYTDPSKPFPLRHRVVGGLHQIAPINHPADVGGMPKCCVSDVIVGLADIVQLVQYSMDSPISTILTNNRFVDVSPPANRNPDSHSAQCLTLQYSSQTPTVPKSIHVGRLLDGVFFSPFSFLSNLPISILLTATVFVFVIVLIVLVLILVHIP